LLGVYYYRMTLAKKLLLAGFAVGITVLGLLLATYAGGPAVRKVFGVPEGFQEHFFSAAAFREALAVQAIAVGLAFFVFGIASRRLLREARYSDAVWIANPLTVGVGFATYKSIYHALYPAGYFPEYDSPLALLILCLAAPAAFAGCFYLGATSFAGNRKAL
jgi:hypothetical protein